MTARASFVTWISLSLLSCGVTRSTNDSTNTHPDLVAVEIFTIGMDLLAGSPVVLLRQPDSGELLPIWVGLPEAQAIGRALHGVQTPRPMTHDLIATLLDRLQAKVVAVVVHDLRESTYHGRIELKTQGQDQNIQIDSRPSDALALALRTGSEILVTRKLLIDIPHFDFAPPDESQQVVRLLGLTLVAPNPDLRRQFKLPDRPGAFVRETTPAARRLGIEAGDLVVTVNQQPVTSPVHLFEVVLDTREGKPLELGLLRAGKEITVRVPWDTPSPSSPSRRPGLRV
jgi:uncharacterized protein